MIGDMGLAVMNSNNMELRWKLVKRGRSSRKSSGRGVNKASKLGDDFTSPKSVGDFSGSDFHKLGDGLLKQSSSGKLDSVPIKKRRHLLCKNYIPHFPSPSAEDNKKLDLPRCSSGDFSGIELLAAAASMDDELDMCGDQILVTEEFLMKPKSSDVSSPASPSEILARSNGSDESSNYMKILKGVDSELSKVASDSPCASQIQCRSTPSEILSKAVKREHWDLNIVMDAWDEPCDSMAGLKDVDSNVKMTKGLTESNEHVVLNEGGDGTSAEQGISRLGEDSIIVSPGETCIKFSSMETQNGPDSNDIVSNHGDKATENVSSGRADDKILCFDSIEKTRDHAINTDDKHASSISFESRCTSVTDGKVKSSCDKSNLSIQAPVLHEMSEPVELHCQGFKDSCSFDDMHSLLASESKDQIKRSSTIVSEEACNQETQDLSPDFSPDHEDKNLPLKEPMRNAVQDSNKSSIPGVFDDPATFDGMLDSAKNTQQDSDVSQAHNCSMVQGGNLKAADEEHDSPYEDGELRGSCMYSWVENECVDYESDGRNEDKNDMDDSNVPDLAEGISEVSHGMERRNLISKRYPKVSSMMNNFVTGDGENDEIGGKASKAGSGTSIEQPMETVYENGDSRKRRQFTDGAFDVKMRKLTEHASSKPRGKLQSRFEEMDAGDMNGSFFTSSTRSRQRGNSYLRLPGDISLNKYMGRQRYTPVSRDEVQWTSKCRTSDYRVSETHSRSRNNSNRYFREKELLDSRQNDTYTSRALRRSGPSIEREDYAGVGRRSRGHNLYECDRGFDDSAQVCSDNRNGNLSQYCNRGSQSHILVHSSRSKSPRMWKHSSRSPDYTFTPRDHVFPHKRRRSPVRVFKRNHHINSAGKLSSDEYCRSGNGFLLMPSTRGNYRR